MPVFMSNGTLLHAGQESDIWSQEHHSSPQVTGLILNTRKFKSEDVLKNAGDFIIGQYTQSSSFMLTENKTVNYREVNRQHHGGYSKRV